jgi:hypothetical protein
MQQRFLPWLDRPEKDLDPLKAWLSGRNLPPVGDEFAPYDLICQAIPLDEFGSGDYFIALVERTAQLLAEQARNRLREPAEPGFHANLFRLTALLRDPRAFAEPLRLIYGELKAEEANLPVAGRAALLAGLVWNQFDDGLIEDWFEMAVNGSDVLPGNHLDGIRALRLVPKENGIPHYKALAKAVKVQEIRDDRTRPSTNEETRRLLMDLKRQELADSLKHAVELLLAGPAFAGWGYSTEKAFAEMLPTEWSLMALSDPSITEWRRRLLLGIASDDRCERVAARFNISGSVVVRAQYNVSPVIRTADQEWDLKLREAAAAASLAAVA